MPAEIPLEPGESPPSFRRKVYTLYQLSQNLIDNVNKDEESISDLELALQVQAKLAEAALGLANESNVAKVSCFTVDFQNKYLCTYNISFLLVECSPSTHATVSAT